MKAGVTITEHLDEQAILVAVTVVYGLMSADAINFVALGGQYSSTRVKIGKPFLPIPSSSNTNKLSTRVRYSYSMETGVKLPRF